MSDQQQKRLSRKELIKRNKRVAKKRQSRLAILGVIITVFLVYVSGIYGASLAYFGDFLSSALVYVQFGNGFPVETQLSTLKQANKMGSSLCVLDADSMNFYSPTGGKGFTYFHSMQSPVMATSDNRVAIYNPNQTSLKISNAQKILFSTEMEDDIIHVSMSKTNKVAVLTKSQSYNGKITLYNYKMDKLFVWSGAKSFPISSFLSPNGQTLAINTVLAQDGYLISDIYIIDAEKGEEKFVITNSKTIPLAVEFINENRMLVLYTDKAQMFSLQDQSSIYEYSYNGDNLLSYDLKNGEILLALGSHDQGENNRMVMLSSQLEEKFSHTVEQSIKDVIISSARIYLLGADTVNEYSLTGQSLSSKEAENTNKTLVDFNGPVLISKNKMEKLEKTEIKK